MGKSKDEVVAVMRIVAVREKNSMVARGDITQHRKNKTVVNQFALMGPCFKDRQVYVDLHKNVQLVKPV